MGVLLSTCADDPNAEAAQIRKRDGTQSTSAACNNNSDDELVNAKDDGSRILCVSSLTAAVDDIVVDTASIPAAPTGLDELARQLKHGARRKIVVMVGAGISVAAGIPDFRTPGTGLYSNLQKYDLPHAEAIFTLSYFKKKPAAFYTLAKELFPGGYKPTVTHYFIRLLHQKGLLVRCFTQNIDSLESQAGLPKQKLVSSIM